MANSEIEGVNIGLYADVSGTMTLVAARQNVELEETTETIDIGHADNYGWLEKLPGQQDFTFSWDGLMLYDEATGSFAASHEALRQTKRNGNLLSLQLRYPGGLADAGDAIITSLTLTAPYDEAATFAIEGEGTGGLEAISY